MNINKQKKVAKQEIILSKWSRLAKILEHAFVATLILGTLGFFWSCYFGFREKMLDTYYTMSNNIEDLVFLDEDLYSFCNSPLKMTTKDPQSSCSCLKDIELFKIRETMGARFANIFKNMRSLGGMMSYKSYYQIHRLTSWNNLLLSSEKGICGSGLLVPFAKMDKWRDEILAQISRERELQRGSLYSLKMFFLYIFTDIENDQYESFNVDLKTLPIYIDSKK